MLLCGCFFLQFPDRCNEFPLWCDPVPNEIFLCFITASSFHLLAFSTLTFSSIYILVLSVFLSTPSYIHIFLAAAALFVNTIVNCMPLCCGSVRLLSWSFILCSSLVLTLLLWVDVNPWNSTTILSVPLILLPNVSVAASFCGLSYKCHFPSKISTFLCLHALCSFSLNLCYLWEVLLNMHLCLFCPYPLFFFFRFTCSYAVCISHGIFPFR